MVISINNNAFAYSFTSNVKPSGMESSIIKYSNKGKSTTYFYNNNNNNNNNPPNLLESIVNINLNILVNIKNLIININFFNCYFNNNR